VRPFPKAEADPCARSPASCQLPAWIESFTEASNLQVFAERQLGPDGRDSLIICR
jgi:hypothetical protein